jgi:prolyl oligopeptidase
MALALTAARFALRWWPVQRVQRELQRLPAAPRRRSVPTDAQHLARLIHLSVRVLPWHANCLHRSLVLWWLLDRRDVPADLRLGVRRVPGAAAPDFHAWIELDGQVVNDRTDIRELYSTFEPAGVGPAP